MVILLLAFGSVIAMGLPIGTALAGLGAGIALMTFLSAFIHLPSTTEALRDDDRARRRHRLALVHHHAPPRRPPAGASASEDAIGRAIATAGQSVVIAGGAVVIAIVGLAVAGIPMWSPTWAWARRSSWRSW